jgi:hypothetical protein
MVRNSCRSTLLVDAFQPENDHCPMIATGHGRAWMGCVADGVNPSDSCRRRCTAGDFWGVPT